MSSDHTEDTLGRQSTVEYLERQLGSESVYVHNNEGFGPDSLPHLMNEDLAV